jgi:hypothetical protein
VGHNAAESDESQPVDIHRFTGVISHIASAVITSNATVVISKLC